MTAKETEVKKVETEESITTKIQKTADSMVEKVKEYNEQYVVKTVDKGREMLKEYNDKYLAKLVEKGKKYVDGPYQKVSKIIDDMVEKGRTIEKDTMKRVEEYVTKGRDYIVKLPVVKEVEKKVNTSLKAIPGMINLPGKEDIERLTKAMETLNANIEALKKQSAS